jgi:ABC-type multidrug transport system fused ATPase/permease subunit
MKNSRAGKNSLASLKSALEILPSSTTRSLVKSSIFQVFLSFLDLIAVGLVGFLGTISVSGIQSQEPTGLILKFLKIMRLDTYSFQKQFAMISILAVALLVSKSIISAWITKRFIGILSNTGAQISVDLISRFLAMPYSYIRSKAIQNVIFASTRGVDIVMIQVIAPLIVLASDGSLLFLMFITLFIVDPITALLSLFLFGSIGLGLYLNTNSKVKEMGRRSSEINIQTSDLLANSINSYKEIYVKNRLSDNLNFIQDKRFELSYNMARLSFIPYIGKYILETAVILGAVVIGSLQFILQDSATAVANFSIFIIAGTRIAPAVLRIQQGAVQMRSGMGLSAPTINLNLEIAQKKIEKNEEKFTTSHLGFDPTVSVKEISYSYTNNSSKAISEVSLEILPGQFIALVGPSGAGKSTMVDLILGILEPDDGYISLSKTIPREAINRWPGATAYVPQEVHIINGSISENVTLGYHYLNYEEEEEIYAALEIADLTEYVSSLPEGIHTNVGEFGNKLSGGQKQRLGIARAVFSKPRLLVLDEATSALDGIAEENISKSIHNLRGDTTIIVVAHRLSTIKNADVLHYFEKGKVIASGSFENLILKVPDFARQVSNMKL